MEKEIAIMIADLSGYTAMTETHGPATAADLIDKYIRIAENCLVGDCKIHERTGDEIMIVSSSPDFLLATAFMIEGHTSVEDHFLQLHGGLHFGKVLMRNNSYFGSAINLTSRIASRAKAGSFWCSLEFVSALTGKSAYIMESRGVQSFKNISKGSEVFEANFKNKRRLFIDPVCSMQLVDLQNAISSPNDDSLYFCSSHCLDLYITNSQQRGLQTN